MELKTKYQYTYFIYPYIVDEKKYDKYLLKLLNNKNCTIHTFEKEKDADLYQYFLPKIRNYLFWSIEYGKSKVDKLNTIEKNMQAVLLAGYPCVIFDYNLEKDIQGKVGKSDGIFFNITKMQLICFNTGICFLNIKTTLEGENTLADLCNFNYRFRDIKSSLYNFNGHENIQIQTDMFESRKDLTDLIKQLTGTNKKALQLNLDTDRFFVYSYACIGQEEWNQNSEKEIFQKEFLKYSSVKPADYKMDYEQNSKHVKIVENSKYELYGFTKTGTVLLTADINTENYTKLPHIYERQLLYSYIFELYQKIYMNKINLDFKKTKNVNEVQKEFVDFTQSIWIEEITNDDFGNLLCNYWENFLKNNTLYSELKNKYDTLYKNANIEKTQKTNNWIVIILIILVILNIISLFNIF